MAMSSRVVTSGLAFGMIRPALLPEPVPEPPVLFAVSLMPKRNAFAMDCRFGYLTFPPTAACISKALLGPYATPQARLKPCPSFFGRERQTDRGDSTHRRPGAPRPKPLLTPGPSRLAPLGKPRLRLCPFRFILRLIGHPCQRLIFLGIDRAG